jgi:hypothetical protein
MMATIFAPYRKMVMRSKEDIWPLYEGGHQELGLKLIIIP